MKPVTEYFITSSRKKYKILENGDIFTKLLYENDDDYTKLKNVSNQINLCGVKYTCRKKFLYEIFNNCKIKKNERVVFKNRRVDYSKDNLILKRKSKLQKNFFKKINKDILHYDIKNNLLGTYSSQNNCSKITGVIQSYISSSLIRGSRMCDGSYYIYNGDKLKKIPNNVSIRKSIGNKLNITQCDLNCEIINRFDSITTALDFLEMDKQYTSHIVKCLKRKRKSAYGFIWRYNDDVERKKNKKFVCYYEYNKLEYVFESRKELCDKLNISKSMLSSIISGRAKPLKYEIKEVTYEVGFELKKKNKLEETDIVYKRDILKPLRKINYYNCDDVLLKTYSSFEDITSELGFKKENVINRLKYKTFTSDRSYFLYEDETVNNLNENVYLYYENDIVKNIGYTLSDLSEKVGKSTTFVRSRKNNRIDNIIVKKVKYSEAVQFKNVVSV